MGFTGRCPQTIVTDIDSGLRNAISRELPNTKHIIFIWHILSKFSSWFSLPLGTRFGLAANKHMALLFSYGVSWAICCIRGYFLAHTMTVEFSQSIDTFLKRILSGQSCLQVFFEQVLVGIAAGFRNHGRD